MTAAIFQNDVGLELRVRFREDSLVHCELSRKGEKLLLACADDIRLVLLGQGRIELSATDTAH